MCQIDACLASYSVQSDYNIQYTHFAVAYPVEYIQYEYRAQ